LQSAPNCRIVDPIGEPQGRHAFHVFRPTLAQFGQSLWRRWRPQLLAAIEVAQQQRFVAGSLPDHSYARRLRDGCDLAIAKRRLTQPITIDQHCPMHVGGLTLSFALENSFPSLLHECEGVSATRLEQDHVKVDITALTLEQAADECPIAALALSLAAQEDPATLRNEQAATHHPRWGTAPYTPPRYLR
jgi:hypothetical protein